ncbi:hypothetical protein LTR53_013874 [Teratosphaeriaceae sp. CCFEE 6253]|nr:hypothetical protein LTR53_013874 [Teratosphaeriaceae sp. CCFEE 6253]
MSTRVLIVGGGAIGAFYGARLAAAPRTLVSAVCRSNYAAVRDGGFTLTSPIYGQHVFKPEHVFSSPQAAKQAGVPFDYLLVATKALPDVSDDSSLPEGLVDADTSIVLVQNGLGIEEPYRQRFPRTCILSAVALASVAQPSPGCITHSSATKISLGPYHAEPDLADEGLALRKCARLVALLKAGGIRDAEMHDHAGLQCVRWHKVAVNASMNPSSVLSGQTLNQEMSNDPELARHLLGVMREVLATAPQVLGRPLPSTFLAPEQILRSQQRSNAGFKSSMLQDWEKGRRMELEVILGNPVRIARRHGLEMPRTESMYALLKKAQEHRQRALVSKL